MATTEATVEDLVSMINRGELRLRDVERREVWRASRVCNLVDSLYRGYPCGTILLWDTDEFVSLRELAGVQSPDPRPKMRLLLDGQMRLTFLHAVVQGYPVPVRGRRPLEFIELLFNLEHPDGGGAGSSGETFAVATKELEQLPHWVRTSDVFTTDRDAPSLNPKYRQRLAKLRGIRKYVYRMDVLDRTLSYDEVIEIVARAKSLGTISNLARAKLAANWKSSLQPVRRVVTKGTRVLLRA